MARLINVKIFPTKFRTYLSFVPIMNLSYSGLLLSFLEDLPPFEVMLLNNLAHNIIVWQKNWLSKDIPKIQNYGILRFRRDILQIPGLIETNDSKQVMRIILNNKTPLATELAKALTKILFPTNIIVSSGQI